MTKKIQHPLDSVFNIEEDENFIEDEYAMAEIQENAIQVETKPDEKDADDILVEQRIDEVYTQAIETFQQLTSYTEVIEPRYAARNSEVAANFLNIALQAANSRAKVKNERKKANTQFVPYPNAGKTTNNILVADRGEILKMIKMNNENKEIK